MKLPFEGDATARAPRRTLVVMMFALLGAVPAPTLCAQRAAVATGACKAQGTPSQIEVHCPSATVAELFKALREATGLRSHYALELAATRVSVTSWRGPLLELLENALSAFNFVCWTDEGVPSIPTVSIVGMRGAPETAQQPLEHVGADRDPVVQSEPDLDRTELRPTGSVLPDGDAQTAGMRETPQTEMPETPQTEVLDDTPATAMEPDSANGNVLVPPTAGATPLEPIPAEVWSGQVPGANTQP